MKFYPFKKHKWFVTKQVGHKGRYSQTENFNSSSSKSTPNMVASYLSKLSIHKKNLKDVYKLAN